MDEGNFLHDVELSLGVSRDKAHQITAAVFHELHDRLTVKEANDLAAQLPGELKVMWHGYDSPGREVSRTHKAQFIRRVAEEAEISEIDARHAIVSVFRELQKLLHSPTGQEGEAWHILSQLPKDLKKLWTGAAPSR